MTDTTEQVVEQPAPDAIGPTTVETPEPVQADSSPAADDADDSSAPRPKGVQKRIDELTRNWREAERREAALMAMLQKQHTPAKQDTVVEKPKAVPRLEDFNYDESAYQAALFEHASAEAARKVREELKREDEQRKQSERVKSWKARESEFRTKNPDYEDVAYYAPINEAMADIIQESELGPQVAYYLGKNLDEARAITEMSPTQAARALGRIEAKLEKPPTPPPAPKPAVSQAPPPPPRLEATEPAVEKDPDQMSMGDWLKWRNKQLSRKKA